jgi:deazaflavin-dependent oxidoreductase (nitroreductase family)
MPCYAGGPMTTKAKSRAPGETAIGKVVIKAMSSLNTWIYRTTGGRLGGRFPGGAPLLLLTTVGRKSGQPRTTPLIYLSDGDDLAVVASKAGMDNHPLWYTNLVANPDVEVEVGRERRLLRARTATAEEKARLWPKLVAIYPTYEDYQKRTEREIPVVILSPRERAAA